MRALTIRDSTRLGLVPSGCGSSGLETLAVAASDLDRLRAELERAAAIEDRRERRPALGRCARRRDCWQFVIAAAPLVAGVVLAGCVDTRGEERSATPAPTSTPASLPLTDPKRFCAASTTSMSSTSGPRRLRRMRIPYDPPPGWWRIVVQAPSA